MSLEGANVERVTAQLDLDAEYADRVDLRNSFTVHVRDRSGADYRYASADGDLDIGPAAGPLAIHLEALAVDTINDLFEEMRDVGYDGPHPLAAHTLQWFISDDLQAAQQRLDRHPPPKPVRVIATGVHVDEYPDPEHALAEARRVVPRNRSPEDRADITAWKSGALLFIRTTAFVEFDAGEGPDRWNGTPQGPFAIDPNQPATSAVLHVVEHNDDLIAEFGINGIPVSRIDFYAAPRRIEIHHDLSRRMTWD